MAKEDLGDDAPLSEIDGFKVLRLRPRYMPDGSSKVLFFKEHQASKKKRSDDAEDEDDGEKGGEGEGPGALPEGRTLFVTNPSFYFQPEDLSAVFSGAGRVERVVLGALGRGGSGAFLRAGCAHVVFAQSRGLQKCLRWTEGDARKIACPTPPRTGLPLWLEESRAAQKSPAVLRRKADGYLAAFDKLQATKRAEEQKSMDPDAEGWVTITSKSKRRAGKTPQASASSVRAGNFIANKPDSASVKAKVLDDFYRFQQRERRQKELEELRESFEKEKQRISRIHGDRHFRP